METKTQDDKDLLIILTNVKIIFSKIYNPIKLLFIFSLKNIVILSAFSIVGAGIMFSYYLYQKPYYESSISISHNRLENDFCEEAINSLNNLADNPSNNLVLSKKLGIGVEYVKEIKELKFNTLNEGLSKLYNDTISVKLPFKVTAQVYNNDILDTLQKGILFYLENNEYIKKVKQIDLMLLEKKIERLAHDINELDSLKTIVNQSIIPRSTGNGIILGEPVNPVGIYNVSYHLYETKHDVQKEVLLNNSFELIVEFTPNSSSKSVGKTTYTCIGILIGYLLGLFFLLRNKYVK